ncbi:hypothetical protein NIES4103_38750 [Nostoc sp. NIES-4103]|nr:hypothetical protein NIES4103_38750 [Nostoc sp. NIES-4103]
MFIPAYLLVSFQTQGAKDTMQTSWSICSSKLRLRRYSHSHQQDYHQFQELRKFPVRTEAHLRFFIEILAVVALKKGNQDLRKTIAVLRRGLPHRIASPPAFC